MLKHGVIFTHNKQEIVLLLDRVTLSLDDKHDDEFVFATINDCQYLNSDFHLER
jgi:recombinational DNA repair ATPase RecF